MKRTYRKIKNSCEIIITKTKRGMTFKCKNLKRKPKVQEIIDKLK